MKQRCPNCGAKTDGEEVCGKCGYTLYENVFADVAEEVEEAVSRVSDYELSAVRRECGTAEKLSPEEFERKWCAENHIAPVHSAFSFRGAVRGAVYERRLRKAYEEYLRSIGYDI